MAKILPKGKKVTGTKKKDKIVHTGKGVWKKTLTVKAGAGNDVINFKKSNYKNTIYGEAGKDTIYGGKKNDKIYGGKGNDKIYTGKGTNTLYINKGDGNDTIYHQGKKTVIKVNKAKSSDNQSFEKKGNDLIMTYTHGGTKTKEVLTFKNYYKGNKNIYLGKKKLETVINSKGMTITGSGNITGTAGNDIINGSKGNDTINGGKGNNTIYLKKNEGTDTILNGGGNDTLVFSQESNFDNFTFTESGDDLNVTAGGTTAIIKGYNSGKSSVKTIKAGNLSFNKMYRYAELYDQEIYGTSSNDLLFSQEDGYGSGYVKYYMGDGNDILYIDDAYESQIHGGNGNDYIKMTNGEENYIYAGAGNDTITLDHEEEDSIYASNGNNYINLTNTSYTDICLKDMTGNNTIATDWYDYVYLDFRYNETSSANNGDEMLRTLQLAEGDDPYYYVLGQKSGNDLIMTTVNNKTVTIKDFYGGYSDGWVDIIDETDNFYLERGLNEHIFFNNPGYVKLTTGDNLINNKQNYYIYGKENIAYNVTMNNVSYNNIDIYGAGGKTINIQNAQQNYIEIGGGVNLTFNGSNNYMNTYAGTSGSTYNITGNSNRLEIQSAPISGLTYSIEGNNNYLEGYLKTATINLNGTGNYAYLEAQNGRTYGASATITVNTAGSNEVDLYIDSGSEDAYSVTYNVTSTGNDIFHQVNYQNLFMNYHYDFAGSAGKNKEITAGYYNNTSISGVDDTGEIKISTNRAKGYVILHNNGSNNITLRDFDWETMTYHRPYPVYYSYAPDIILSGTSEAGLDTTTFANKVKVQYGESKQYNTLNNFVQHFNIDSNNFTFGADGVGYLHNLTNDYLVSSTYSSSNNTYSNYQFSTGRHMVYDAGGSADNLTIAENISDIRMYFNITSEGLVLNSDLYFLNSTEFQNFMKGNTVSGYLDIKSGLGAGQIENVQVGTYSLNYSDLTSTADGSLIQEVTAWLTTNGKDSVADVISTGTDAQKTALFNIYNNHTDFANNNQNLYWGQG